MIGSTSLNVCILCVRSKGKASEGQLVLIEAFRASFEVLEDGRRALEAELGDWKGRCVRNKVWLSERVTYGNDNEKLKMLV